MLAAAYLIFLGNFCFGLAVRFGVLPCTRFRTVHRLLYIAVVLALAAAIVAGLWRSPRIPWLLLLTELLLLGVPLFRRTTGVHAAYAVVCFAVYTTAIVLEPW